MADLTGQQLKNSYQNLVTIDATIESNPTSGQLENGLGNPITALGIGTDSPGAPLHIEISANEALRLMASSGSNTEIKYGDNNVLKWRHGTVNGGVDFRLREETAGDIITVKASGNVGIGSSNPSNARTVIKTVGTNSANEVALALNHGDSGLSANQEVQLNFGQGDNASTALAQIAGAYEGGSFDGALIFKTNTGSIGSLSERMRILSSGNVLVGKTVHDSGSTAGFQAQSNGQMFATASALSTAFFNRLSSDGDIMQFRKDGSTVGSIGSISGKIFIDLNPGAGGAGLRGGSSSIIPYVNGADADDVLDLGTSGVRFDDVYATNGTIQTSDRNEKQDIEELNDAELRVAQKAKTLLRKFRWKSSVAENENARIHFGIIAQDLEQAFTDEGLDAGRYGMFIKSTWTNEQGEEQTRLGVRYNQLLAFIISAL